MTINRRHFLKLSLTGLAVVANFKGELAFANSKSKKIISFNDNPDQWTFAQYLSSYENSLFDGFILNINLKDRRTDRGQLRFCAFSDKALSWDDFKDALEVFGLTKSRKLRDNFLLLNVRPGHMDWFGPRPDAIANNFQLIGRFCRLAQIKGIFFDPEEYEGPVWSISQLPTSGIESHANHRRRAEQCGYNIALAFLKECPNGSIFLPHPNMGFMGDSALELFSYFLNGVVQAISSIQNAQIQPTEDRLLIVSTENTYRSRRSDEFNYYHQKMLNFDHPDLNKDFWKVSQIAMACSPLGGSEEFDFNDFNKNFSTPAEFEMTLDNALMHSDRYCWVYTRRVSWIKTPVSILRTIPLEYRSALKNVRVLNNL